MTPKTTRAARTVGVLAGIALLSSCAGAQPGVAARVGEDTLTVARVNELAADYCDSYRTELEGSGTSVPLGVLSSGIVQRLSMRAVAEQLAQEAGVEASTQYTAQLSTLQQTAEELAGKYADARVEVESASAYVADIVSTVGRQALEADGVQEPTEEEVTARGRDLFSTWIASHDIEIDPQYGFEIVDVEPVPIDTSTSFAVSDAALAGSAVETDPEYVASLPAAQRCP